MLVVDFIVEHLINNGMDVFFVLTGGAIAPFVDAIGRNKRAKLICVQHEQAASMAVDGYYRATGRPATVAVTSGPGVQNILNGLCGCYYDSVPALFLSGQVNVAESLDAITARPRQVGFQEMPVIDCLKPFSKYICKVMDKKDVMNCLIEALSGMVSGRLGPSVLDIPVNIQMSVLDPFELAGMESVARNPQVMEEILKSTKESFITELSSISHLIQSSRRPLFILGNGARQSRDAVAKLIRELQIPFTASWGALDLFSVDLENVVPTDLFLGLHGVYGDRVANFAIQNADLLIILGARLDTRQTGGNLKFFSTQSRKIMVDIDRFEIDKLIERGIPIDHGVTMDIQLFVSNLFKYQTSLTKQMNENIEWKMTLKRWMEKYGNEIRPADPTPLDVNSSLNRDDSCRGESERQIMHVSPYDLLAKLNTILPHNAIVSVDTGATLVWSFQTLRSRHPQQRIFSNLGNSSMGYALPAAIGAAIGQPHCPVYCIIGDGGFQQNIQELATAVHYNLNIKIFVMNNRGYGIIKQFQNSYLGGRHIATNADDLYGPENKGIDFCAVAEAYGVPAIRVIDIEDVSPQRVIEPGMVVFDVQIHESQGIQPKVDFGNSLENMTPFVDCAGDMLIKGPPFRKASGWQVVSEDR